MRPLIQGAGFAGDPAYVPWLIKQMETIETTRLAGEAFSLVTGLDLAFLDLDRKPPENLETGPSDDADDPNVDRDQDEDLPWPDVDKIRKWWLRRHRAEPRPKAALGFPMTSIRSERRLCHRADWASCPTMSICH